ncbi:MAG TPA: helicase HerA-like domain-containing protein, partial [Hyphomicrobiaceae bacterium]|nr:helicase HerA-like domain-containing protein [Hyphomicrobiaceae bacterium]
MNAVVHSAPGLDTFAAAFEHSITWEDDIWQADPVDVDAVHKKAREKFHDLLGSITDSASGNSQSRILLFHGQSGAGKTHLIRALRTQAHRKGQAFFGYAQMTPDISNYADYFLRRLIASLEKPYHPDDGGESGLARLTRMLVAASLPEGKVDKLRESDLNEEQLARMVMDLADDIVASDAFADQDLDINIIRALLYLQRSDPRVDQRIRQYLFGRQLNDMSLQTVRALDPNTGDGRAFEIIEALGRIMWIVDRAAMVFCIDQVEDLRNFDDPEDRFTKAVGNLMQIANRVPTSIVIISVLEEFYGQARAVLHQSYIDRIEKSGPVALYESRNAEEAKQIIARRLEHEAKQHSDGPNFPDASAFFGPEFFEEFAGLSTRRLLELAQNRLRNGGEESGDEVNADGGLVSTLAAALGFANGNDDPGASEDFAINYREMWEVFSNSCEAEIPSDDQDLIDVLSAGLVLSADEWGGKLSVDARRAEIADDLPAIDLTVTQPTGHAFDARIYLCNRPTQGGGLKRQLDKVLSTMQGRTCFMLRASDFPPNKKNQTAQAYRKFRDSGGRSLLVPIPEWERIMTIREFHAHHRNDPGFGNWFEQAKLLSSLISVIQLLRLDLMGRGLPAPKTKQVTAPPSQITYAGETPEYAPLNGARPDSGAGSVVDFDAAYAQSPQLAPGDPAGLTGPHAEPDNGANPGSRWADWLGWNTSAAKQPQPVPANDDDVPLSVILDEGGTNANSILAGRETDHQRPVTLNKEIMKRHAAVLGGSGSGKTTLALSMIEQLLSRGIPAVLIDRKGDLCSYANPDVWRDISDEPPERTAEREKLADTIDVAVYTPGRSSGRPISITLLPTGMNELPDHEQQLLSNLSAAALGDMLHLKNSATHQKQSGTLSVALRILGSRSAHEVTLSDLITFLEDEDPELTDLTQRMDPSGKIRRDLVAQLDSLRYRNAALFDGGGEALRMEALLGLGPYAREGRTRLSVIYTGFLGDNENILFWVSQFLSETLRFCQRNPNDDLQAVIMFDEADLYIPANAKPATAEPLQSLLKRARSAGLGLMLATQSPGDLDYKSRDQITSWFIGRVREDTALRKLKAAFQSESGLDPAVVLPHQTVGQFHLVQEGYVRSLKAQRSLISAEQVPFDR